jgi:hypothetical protein
MLPFPFSLFEASSEQKENPLIGWAQAAIPELRRIQTFLETEQDRRWVADCARTTIVSLLQYPQLYRQPDRTADLLLEYGINKAKAEWGEDTNPKIWALATEDPRPETARCGAMFAAEYIWRALGKSGGTYELPLKEIFSGAANADATKASILAIQNALVDHVAEHQGDTALTRGAAILALLAEEPGSELWTKKLTDVKIRHVYSDKHGDVTKYVPVYTEITPQ